jgi:hypothetical protein
MNIFKISVMVTICSIGILNCSEPKTSVQSTKQIDKAVQTNDIAAEAKKDEEQKEYMEIDITYYAPGGPHFVDRPDSWTITGRRLDVVGFHQSTEHVAKSSLKKGATVADLANVLASQLSPYHELCFDKVDFRKKASFKFSKHPKNFTFYEPVPNGVSKVLAKDADITSHKKLITMWSE